MKSWLTRGSSNRWMTPLHWTTFLHKKHSNYFKAISENVFQIVTLDGEENEPRKPSNTVRSLIPDTNNLESSNGIHNLAKKRRSFIPAEEYAEPEASKSESSVAPTVALTSGDSDDSDSGLTGIRTLALISMFFVHNLQYNNDNFENKQLFVQPPPFINSKRRKASCNFPTINYRKPFIHSFMFIRHISNHEKVKKVTEGDSEETWKKPRGL